VLIGVECVCVYRSERSYTYKYLCLYCIFFNFSTISLQAAVSLTSCPGSNTCLEFTISAQKLQFCSALPQGWSCNEQSRQLFLCHLPIFVQDAPPVLWTPAHATLHLAALVSGGVAVQRSQGREFGRAAWPVRGWAGPGYGTIQRLSSIQTRDSDYLRPQTQTPGLAERIVPYW
jgi:hypothetical protein